MVYSKSEIWVKKQYYFCNMAKKFIPERYENIEVVDINQKGKGVVKSDDGKVIFVSGVVPGDQICIET